MKHARPTVNTYSRVRFRPQIHVLEDRTAPGDLVGGLLTMGCPEVAWDYLPSWASAVGSSVTAEEHNEGPVGLAAFPIANGVSAPAPSRAGFLPAQRPEAPESA